MSRPTRRLELVRSTSGDKSGSLLDAIDRTVTGAGARELAARLAAPLSDPRAIEQRLETTRDALQKEIGAMRDALQKEIGATRDTLQKDHESLRSSVQKDMELLRSAMTVRLGSMLMVGFTLLFAALKLT